MLEFPWTDRALPVAQRREALAAALAAGGAGGWLAQRFDALTDGEVESLSAYLARSEDPARAAAWAASASPKVVAAAFAWCALDPSIAEDDRARFAVRGAGLGKHLPGFLNRLAAAAGAGAGPESLPAVPADALSAAQAAGLPRSAPKVVASGFSVHDALMALPDPSKVEVPDGLGAWLGAARLPAANGTYVWERSDSLTGKVNEAVGAYAGLVAQGALPDSVAAAVVAAKTRALGEGDDSGFADTYVRLGGKHDDFAKALDVYQLSFTVPGMPLPQRTWERERYTARFLNRSDPAGLLLGEATNCCQHVGGAGEECAIHGQANRVGGFFAVTDDRGQIVAQSLVWCDDRGRWCMSNLETAGQGGERDVLLRGLYSEAAHHLASVLNTQVSVGTGYSDLGVLDGLVPVRSLAVPPEGLADPDAREQRLLATAPRPDRPSGAPVQGGWRLPDGTRVQLVRSWRPGQDQPTVDAHVSLADGADLGDAVRLAGLCAGGDGLRVWSEGQLVEEFEADAAGPTVAELVGEAAVGRARAAEQRWGPELAAAGLSRQGFGHVEWMLEQGVDVDGLRAAAAAGVPPAYMREVLPLAGTEGVSGVLALHRQGVPVWYAGSLLSLCDAEGVAALYSRGVPEDYAFYLLPGRGVEGVLALIDHDVPLEYASQLGFAGVGEADAVLALHAAGVTVDYISGLPVSSRDAAGVAQVFTAGVPARYAGALWSRTDPDGLVALHAHGVTEQYAFGLLLSGADAAEVVAMHERGVPEGYAWKMLGEAGSDGVLALHAAGVPEEYAWDDHPAGDWDWANPPAEGYRALLGPTDAAGVLALHAGGVEKDYARGLLPHTDVAGVLALHAGGVPDEYARALLGFTDADGVTALHAEGVTALAAERLLAHGCGVDWIVATHAARGQQARPGARAVPEAQLAAGPPAPEPILVRRAGPAGSGYGF